MSSRHIETRSTTAAAAAGAATAAAAGAATAAAAGAATTTAAGAAAAAEEHNIAAQGEPPLCTTPMNAIKPAVSDSDTISQDRRSMSSRSSRASKETLRRRAIYEAEVQIAEIKKEVIAKKLALDIAEIEDQGNDDENSSRVSRVDTQHSVEEWLADTETLPPLPRNTAETRPGGPLNPTGTRERGPPHMLYQVKGPSEPAVPPAVEAMSASMPATRGRGYHPTVEAMSSSVTMPAGRGYNSAPVAYPMKIISYELPSFGGEPADWLMFKKSYETSSATYNFSEFENVTRLQKALTGEAKTAVEDLLRTSSDPGEIMNALEQEFGHPNLLLQCAIQRINTLTRVSESGSELRKFTSVVRNCVSILRNIKADGYINNPQLVSDVISKLTPMQQAQYGEYAMKKDLSHEYRVDLRVSPNLDLVVEFLTYLSKASSYYMPIQPTGSLETPTNVPRINPASADGRRVNPSVATRRPWPQTTMQHRDRVFANVDVSSTDNEVKCVLCTESHDLHLCEKYLGMRVEDRWELVRINKLCFKCLSQNHNRYKCRAKRCDKCRLSHHTSLHYKSNIAATVAAVTAVAEAGAEATPGIEEQSAARVMDTESVTNIGERITKTLLKVLPIVIYDDDNNEINSYALLDDGATVSLIDESLTANLTGLTSALRIVSARGLSVTDDRSRRVTTHIRGPNGKMHAVKLRTIKNLDLPTQSIPVSVMNHTYLRYLDIETYRDAKPMVLLGQDNWQLIVNDTMRRGKSGQPVASHTKMGWVLHGPIGSGNIGSERVNFMVERDELHELVRNQFELESIGITEISRKNSETERALKILDSTSCQVGDRWEVGLLWKADRVELPNNYNYAYKRLLGIEGKMRRDNEFALAYERQINRLIDEKYARRIEEKPAQPNWYLPHFGVTNPNKPNKLRLVFDAAATYQGVSLNDNLLTGPDMLNSLLGVLFKFRQGPIAYSADIADMFLRIKVREPDQGAQMFLWRKAGEHKLEPDKYVMDCMIFGAKSSPTSAIYILNKNASKFEQDKPEAVKAIQDNHYMDDYLDSVESVEKARQLIKDVSEIHASGGFVIRGWVTNSCELRNELPAVVPGKVNLDRSPHSSERTLGMMWIPEKDVLKFDLSFKKLPCDVTDGSKAPTKREFLRFVMSIFDLLGFLYPYTIKSKILLQKIWKSGIGWDETLNEGELDEWKRWLEDIKGLVDLEIPRWFGLVSEEVELHVFGDASELAYSAVAYVVGLNTGRQRTASIVAGKARVTPLKVVSIPRLELQAAVLACRLANYISEGLGIPIAAKYLWTDSKTVLKWIRSDPRDFQKYVSHRLAEIDRKSKTSDWRWVPSAHNPADEATKLRWPTDPKIWFTGPQFLLETKDKWPVDEHNEDNFDDSERLHHICSLQQKTPWIDLSRFSSWMRAVRVMARVFLFLKRCKKSQGRELTAETIREAEKSLLRQAQEESFAEELKTLSDGKELPTGSKLLGLDPFIFESDGLLRVRGRLSAAENLSFDEKHPIILDGRSYVGKLLIDHFHKRALHANSNTVINCIREKYWITHLRATVKNVSSKCQFCRIKRAMPSEPKMADLPALRLENTRRSLVHCGIDYFGPMEVAVGRRREKRWGVIFTCLVTRAVHLEIAASLTADSAIMAVRRFIARRGQPSVIFSDRGTNFVRADVELKAALRTLDHLKLQEDATARGILWRFNPPASPHMGGCWERLVRSVKSALKVTLKERVPREEVLHTLLAEAEMLINSRPLTYVESDPNEPVALTPNHLLLGTASGVTSVGDFHPTDLNARKSWRKAQALADMFWRRWLKEYVPTLQKRQKWLKASRPVKVGDVVLIFDKNQPRNTWPRGRVSQVFPGQDGEVRVVEINLANGNKLKRPTVKVVVLPTDGSSLEM